MKPADLFDFAACKRMPRYDGKGGWVGRQRPPSRPDERGAIATQHADIEQRRPLSG